MLALRVVKGLGGWAETTMATLPAGLWSDSETSWGLHVGVGTMGGRRAVGGASLAGEEYPLTLKEEPASTSSWRL